MDWSVVQFLLAGALAAGVVLDDRQEIRVSLALALFILIYWRGDVMAIDALYTGVAATSWGWLGAVVGAAAYACCRVWPEYEAGVLTVSALCLLVDGEWIKLAVAVVLIAAAGLVRLLHKRPLLSASD